ncbi:hypothetical protein GCM10007859_25100 [Brevundimonas denitrificans]|uniref:Uncharacterized protein n=1 Tax=Brevundimonas denitrificans TaxID=1443434 RepID=A0ABQ6BPR5_9CAUL|nr:hypothetical protein GCM10007859_25100 [Brevundimonas denitrificans]
MNLAALLSPTVGPSRRPGPVRRPLCIPGPGSPKRRPDAAERDSLLPGRGAIRAGGGERPGRLGSGPARDGRPGRRRARHRLPTTRQILPQPGKFFRVGNVVNKN